MFDDFLKWPYRAARDSGFWVIFAWLAIAADFVIAIGLIVGPASWLWVAVAVRVVPWSVGAVVVLLWGMRHRSYGPS